MLRPPRRVERFIEPPDDPVGYSLKSNGEWQITQVTFRDVSLAYSVWLILIYPMIVAQFRSYLVPLVIMAPIPLTVIGVLAGRALLGTQFTATSMIGVIALAGLSCGTRSCWWTLSIGSSARDATPLMPSSGRLQFAPSRS